MTLLSMAPALLAKDEAGVGGFLAIPSTPMAVELGCMFWGSEMDRREGTLFVSMGFPEMCSSSGVVVSDWSSESGEPGMTRSCFSPGVTGRASEPLIAAMKLDLGQAPREGVELQLNRCRRAGQHSELQPVPLEVN